MKIKQQQQKQLDQRQYDSVWYSTFNQFRNDFIDKIADKSIPIEEALDNYRELSVFPKEFKGRTVKELNDDPKLLHKLFMDLRSAMKPPTKFKLPYKIAVRELELKQSLVDLYDNIDIELAKAQVVTGYHDGDGVVFPYALEVVIAPRRNWIDKYDPGELEIIGYVNDSPAIDGGENYFADGFYSWENKKGKIDIAKSARGVLQQCGFDTGAFHASKKRVPCVMMMNLLTPVPGWLGGAGKTHINLNPYARTIAETISNLAYKMPTCHGLGFTQIDYGGGGGREDSQIAKKYLETFLINRKAAVEADPLLKINDRITQSGVWYRIRPIMRENGFEPPNDRQTGAKGSWTKTRRYIQGSISDVIEELWPGQNITREDLGIVAASKGVVLYDGEAWPINGDTVDALAEKGVAIIVIEKEGVADVLAPFARKYGIALAHTGGRFTNAVKKLIERAKKGGSVVRILTDYDAVGMDISAATITPTIRIGIERDIIKWLNKNGYPDLTEEDVEEEYEPSGTTIKIKDPYLLTKRIELDSIQQEVGAESLWEYIMYRLQLPVFNTGFNLTKVIEMPRTENLRPQVVKDVLAQVDEYLIKVIEHREDLINEQLEKAMKLVDIIKKGIQVEEKLIDKVNVTAEKDDGMKTIIAKFQELSKDVLPKPEDYDEEEDDEGLDIMGDDDDGDDNNNDISINSNSNSNSNSDKEIDLEDVEGIGPTSARFLREKGFKSAQDISKMTITKLCEDFHYPQDRAHDIIKSANELVKSGGMED